MSTLTEISLMRMCLPDVFGRARAHYYAGAVRNRRRGENALTAEVQVRQHKPYTVLIEFDAASVTARCTCFQFRDTLCDHTTAALLAWIREPASFLASLSKFDVEMARAMAAARVTRLYNPVVQLLMCHKVGTLRHIARRRGLRLKASDKVSLASQLAEYLGDPAATAASIAALSADKRAALQALYLLADDIGPTAQQLGTALLTLQGPTAAKQVESLLDALVLHGLAVPVRDYYDGLERYQLVGSVTAHIPPLLDLSEPYAGDVARLRVVQEGGLPLTLALYRVWRAVQTSGVNLRSAPQPTLIEHQQHALQGWDHVPAEVLALQDRGAWIYRPDSALTVPPPSPELDDASLAALAPLSGGDVERLDFLWSLMGDLGLIVNAQALEPTMSSFLRQPGAARLHALTRAWLDSPRWTELGLFLRHHAQLRLRRRVSHYAFKKQQLLAQLAQGRRFVARLLSTLPVERWISFPALREAMWRLWPDFLYGRQIYTYPEPSWWFESEVSGRAYDPQQQADWDEAYGAFVTQILEGPLLWLGVVALGYAQDGLAALQVTRLGAYLLGREAPPPVEAAGPLLRVHDDLTATLALDRAEDAVYDFLGQVAELFETDVNEFRYRFTPAQAHRAFEQGVGLDDVLAFIAKHSAAAAPESVRRAWQGWWEAYGRVRLYQGLTVIEFADDFALQELLASTSLSQHLIHAFSPRLVVIDSEAVEPLCAEMVARGYTPQVSQATRNLSQNPS